MRRTRSRSNPQSTIRTRKTILKYYKEFYLLYYITISSLIHLRDQAIYVWTTLDTIRIRSATDRRVIRRFDFSIGRSLFNPHLPSGFSFLSIRDYRLSGVEVSDHWHTTIQGVGRRVAIRRGSLVFIYLGDGEWRRFDFSRSWSSELRG